MEFTLLATAFQDWATAARAGAAARHDAFQLDVATSAHSTRLRVRAFQGWRHASAVAAALARQRHQLQVMLQLWAGAAHAAAAEAGSRWRARQKTRMSGHASEVRPVGCLAAWLLLRLSEQGITCRLCQVMQP